VALGVSMIAAIWFRWALLIPGGYLLTVLATSATERNRSGRARLRLPGIFAVMHLCWGTGFVASLVRGARG
jgi:hypothetical protein